MYRRSYLIWPPSYYCVRKDARVARVVDSEIGIFFTGFLSGFLSSPLSTLNFHHGANKPYLASGTWYWDPGTVLSPRVIGKDAPWHKFPNGVSPNHVLRGAPNKNGGFVKVWKK